MKKLFIHHTLFRVIAPLLYGVLIYVLMLLVFDSVDSLGVNFINQEVLFCIGLTYLMMEVFRGQILLLDIYLPIKKNTPIRILTQIIVSIFLASLISTISVSLYFQYLLGFSKYSTEVLTFNIIYGISALLFNMIYISIAYLNMENNAKLEEEQIKRKNLEYQMLAFNNEINPNFLYASLETLIGLLYENEEDSEQYIEKLSTVYRYILSNKNNELTTVKHEVDSTDALLYILNVKYNSQISFNSKLDEFTNNQYLAPGTINLLIDKMISMTIITERQPMNIKCYAEDDYLVFQVKLNEKLTHEEKRITDRLIEPYEYFTIMPIIELRAYGDLFVKIPLLELVEESEKLSA